MAYVNEHSALIKELNKFEKVTRKNNDLGEGISGIYGMINDESELQSIRFSIVNFTVEQAEKFLSDNKYKVKSFESAAEIDMDNKEVVIENVDLYRAGMTIDGREVSKTKTTKVFENTQKLLKAIPNFKISVKPDGHWSMDERIHDYVQNIRRVKNRIVGDIVSSSMEIISDISK